MVRDVELVPKNALKSMIQTLFKDHGQDVIDYLINDLPKRWERFDDVAVLPINTFSDPKWDVIDRNLLWNEVANALNVNRLFRKGEIFGEKRESTAELLIGTNPDVKRIEHGVKFVYRVTDCMFSQGNLNERKRMGDLNLIEENVLDLYAGIGYYTLPMLVRANAKHVTATEWNANALRDLKKGLKENKVEKRCTVLEGDNRKHGNSLHGKFDRVVLGLLPQPWEGIETAIQSLKSTGGVLHIHGISSSDKPEEWEKEVIQKLSKFNRKIQPIKSIKIKSYAPHWDHRVLDIEVRTLSSNS
ncbi:MAG: hypothetical protein CMA04_003500 [Methanobacteriota archaeon]|nr:MAG: hypothetical protein CMA04_003500 [Euryarchaeota archaeon]